MLHVFSERSMVAGVTSAAATAADDTITEKNGRNIIEGKKAHEAYIFQTHTHARHK